MTSLSRTKIKICGVTTVEDAYLALEMDVDALGFNFYSRSARYIEVNRARMIRQDLPSAIEIVGVFVNSSLQAIKQIQHAVGLHTIQLHGDEPIAFCAQLPSPVIKAFRPSKLSDLEEVLLYPEHVTLLIDAPSTKQYGGTGSLAMWSLAQKIAEQRRLILAGGLNAENVAAAIQQVKPYMVDACSGVEAIKGRKSRVKMQAFCDAIRRCGR